MNWFLHYKHHRAFTDCTSFSDTKVHFTKGRGKNKLEQQIQELKDKIQKLENKKPEAELELDDHKINKDKLQWYSDISDELEKKYGIAVDDISKLAAV